MSATLPAGWSITGQMEQGEEGTTHYQAMLKTPQLRFSAVKKVFPRAHIEIARNAKALANYVHKDESRVSEVNDRSSNIPTLFDYQHTIAGRWDDAEFKALCDKHDPTAKIELGELALSYVDIMVAEDIENGVCGIEYIAINPMWRSAWKKFYRSMVARERKIAADKRQTDRQAEEIEEIPAEIKSQE